MKINYGCEFMCKSKFYNKYKLKKNISHKLKYP